MTPDPLPPNPPPSATAADKDVAFYSAAVQAWIDTRIERDRTLITLSAAGLGVLVTLLTAVGLVSRFQVWLYLASSIGFATTIGICIWVYRENARYIELVLTGPTGVAVNKTLLRQLDKFSLVFFLVGVITMTSIGFTTAYAKGFGNAREETTAESRHGAEEPARTRQTETGEPGGPGQAPATPATSAPNDSARQSKPH